MISNYINILFSFIFIFMGISVLTFSFFPLHTGYMLAFCAVLYFFFHLTTKKICFNKKAGLVIFLISLLFCYASMSYIFICSEDPFLIVNTLKIFINFCFIAAFIVIYAKKTIKDKEEDLFVLIVKKIQIVIFIVSISVLMSFYFPAFRLNIENIFPAQGNILDSQHFAYTYRVRGILPSAGAYASVFFAIGSLFTFFLFSIEKNVFRKIYYFFSFTCLLPAILLNGRTGIFYILFFLLLYIMMTLKKNLLNYYHIKIKSYTNPYKGTIISLFVILFVFYCVGRSMFPSAYDRLLSEFYFIGTGQIHDSTFGALKKMVIVPNDFFTFMFGDSLTYSIHRINSDIGYIRMLNAVGLCGFIMYYGTWACVSFMCIRFSKYRRQKDMVKIFFILLFILEAKEPFFSFAYIQIIIFIFFTSIVVKPRFKSL